METFLLSWLFNYALSIEATCRRMINDRKEVGGMKTGGRNRSTDRKPAPMPLCPPQIPHNLTWDWTEPVAAVGSLTSWAMARPDSRFV
jgi:hypothetical protein